MRALVPLILFQIFILAVLTRRRSGVQVGQIQERSDYAFHLAIQKKCVSRWDFSRWLREGDRYQLQSVICNYFPWPSSDQASLLLISLGTEIVLLVSILQLLFPLKFSLATITRKRSRSCGEPSAIAGRKTCGSSSDTSSSSLGWRHPNSSTTSVSQFGLF